MPYRIVITPRAQTHLAALSARERAIVVEAIAQQLRHEAEVETRNRKPMRPNWLAPWELRVGMFRVYFEVEAEPEAVVHIRAIGTKLRDKISIGGEEVDL